MKSAYLSTSPLDDSFGRQYRETIARKLRDWGYTNVAVELTPGAPQEIQSRADEDAAAPHIDRALRQLQDRGFTAAVIGCFADPGLKNRSEYPGLRLVGPGESSIRSAAEYARPFAVITVANQMVERLKEMVGVHDPGLHCLQVTSIDVDVREVRADKGDATLLARFEDSAMGARRLGAETLILGCMSPYFSGLAEELQRRTGLNVPNAVRMALDLANTEHTDRTTR